MHISQDIHELLNETKKQISHVHRVQKFQRCLGSAAVEMFVKVCENKF